MDFSSLEIVLSRNCTKLGNYSISEPRPRVMTHDGILQFWGFTILRMLQIGPLWPLGPGLADSWGLYHYGNGTIWVVAIFTIVGILEFF